MALDQTAYEYEAEYNRNRKKEYSKYHGYAYDGVWTIAYAIHLVDIKLRAQNSRVSFKDFKYRDPQWAQFFRQALKETSFTGVTVSRSWVRMDLSDPLIAVNPSALFPEFPTRPRCAPSSSYLSSFSVLLISSSCRLNIISSNFG